MHYAHGASASQHCQGTWLRSCLLSTRSKDRAIGDDGSRSPDGATWFEYRRCSLSETGSRRGIRDSYSFDARTVSVMGSRIRHFPSRPSRFPSLPPPLRAVHSLPSEITAVALTAFSHVPVARVVLVVLGNERKISEREENDIRRLDFRRKENSSRNWPKHWRSEHSDRS